MLFKINRIFSAACLILLICFSSCKAQPYSKIITLISEVDERGEIYGKTDTASVEYITSEGIVYKKVIRGTIIRTRLYDSRGKVISQISDYGNGFIVHTDNLRDFNGYIISSKSYDSKSTDTTWIDYLNIFNKDSSVLLSDAIIRENKNLDGKYRMRFDQNKNIIEDTELDSLNNEITKNIYDYTKENKVLKQSYYEKGVLISSTQYTYDGKKKIGALLTPTAKERKKIKSRFIYQ